jgi:hypothetical protein
MAASVETPKCSAVLNMAGVYDEDANVLLEISGYTLLAGNPNGSHCKTKQSH